MHREKVQNSKSATFPRVIRQGRVDNFEPHSKSTSPRSTIHHDKGLFISTTKMQNARDINAIGHASKLVIEAI